MEVPTDVASFRIDGGSPSDRRRFFSDSSVGGIQSADLARAAFFYEQPQAGTPTRPATPSSGLTAEVEQHLPPSSDPTSNRTKHRDWVLGAADCGSCTSTPAYLLAPCGHTICANHHKSIPAPILEHLYCVEAVCGNCWKRTVSGILLSDASHLSAPTKSQLELATSTSQGFLNLADRAANSKAQKECPSKSVSFNLPLKISRRQSKPPTEPSPLTSLFHSLEKSHFGLEPTQSSMTSPAATAGARPESLESSSSQPFLVQEPSPRKPWFSNQVAMFEPVGPRRSSEGSTAMITQTSQSPQQSHLGHVSHSKSTPNMAELGNCPSTTSMRGTSMWNNQSTSYNLTPRITPSPITESPDEDVFPQPSESTSSQHKGKAKATDFPSPDIIDEINARIPQLSIRQGSFSSESPLTTSRRNSSAFTTPNNDVGRQKSYTGAALNTVPFSGEVEQSITPTPQDKARAEKRRLVDLIKSGVLTPDDDRSSHMAVVPRQRDQNTSNAVQFTPTFVDLAYHVSTTESTDFFEHLQKSGGQLSLNDAFNLIPFVEKARMAKPKNWGVIRITNIPYGTTKPEIVAFVGRNARLVQQPQGSPWFAIHIIMERSTAKTMDCYVEFETHKDADHAVDRFKRQCANHRHPRIGDRHVDVTISSQAALMKEVFPRAKCVRWEGQDPHIYESTEPYNSGFKGFTTSEEMVVTIKHAETPQRSPFSHKCYQRTYESMITLLYKFPWWSVQNYTLGERDRLHHATITLIKALYSHRFRHVPTNPQQLTLQLHQELVFAGLNCPGFSERQKYMILKTAVNHYEEAPGRDTWWGLTQYAPTWIFQTLGRREGVGEDMLTYFVRLLFDASTSTDFLSLAEHRSAVLAIQQGRASPFGKCEPEFDNDFDHTTMADAAHIEWATIESFLRRICPASRRSSGTSVAGLLPDH